MWHFSACCKKHSETWHASLVKSIFIRGHGFSERKQSPESYSLLGLLKSSEKDTSNFIFRMGFS